MSQWVGEGAWRNETFVGGRFALSAAGQQQMACEVLLGCAAHPACRFVFQLRDKLNDKALEQCALEQPRTSAELEQTKRFQKLSEGSRDAAVAAAWPAPRLPADGS